VGGVVNNNYNKGANNMDGYAVLSISLRKKKLYNNFRRSRRIVALSVAWIKKQDIYCSRMRVF
jgi:hypothetical protein